MIVSDKRASGDEKLVQTAGNGNHSQSQVEECAVLHHEYEKSAQDVSLM